MKHIKLPKNREAFIIVKDGNLQVQCDKDLKIDEFLNLKSLYNNFNHLKSDELQEEIDNYNTKIAELEDIKNEFEIMLSILKYKNHESIITIEENADILPF